MHFSNKIAEKFLINRKFNRNEDLRGYFFRDTTAIVHSYPFRRLKSKTQVFFSPKNDHICTRIEHVMHVATIAATVCRALELDVDLAWAISLGHDLGHTPFGHVGEQIISKIQEERGRGHFAHEVYSLRVVDHLIGYGKGLNLTYAVRDGIINHCGEKFEKEIEPEFTVKNLEDITNRNQYPSTWEGAIVRMSDKIAYLGRDMEDAIQLRLIDGKDVPENSRKILGNSNSEIIDTLVKDLIRFSKSEGVIGFSKEKFEAVLELKAFNYENIYGNPRLASYHEYFGRILNILFTYLENIFTKYQFETSGYKIENNMLSARFGDYLAKMKHFYLEHDMGTDNIVLDYVAGMTDDFAIDSISEIMVPRRFERQFDDLLLD